MFTIILGDIKVSQSVSNEMRYSDVTKPFPQVLPIYVAAIAICGQYLFSIFQISLFAALYVYVVKS